MATVTREINPQSGHFRSTAFPQIVQANGSNYPVSGLAFDAGVTEHVYYTFEATDYGSGNVTVGIYWYADTSASASHDVVWAVQLGVITPNSDTQNIETDGLATVNNVTDANTANAQQLHYCEIAVSNLDSLAADDYVTMDFYRDHDHANDDLTGDAIVTKLTISYSDA